MFEIKKKNSTVKICLKETCSIMEIEEFYNEITKIAKNKKIKKFEIIPSKECNIDTSYFQILISLKNSGFNIVFPKGKKNLEEIEALYGIKI